MLGKSSLIMKFSTSMMIVTRPLELIEEFAKRENDRIKYIRFSLKWTAGVVSWAGFKYASGDAVMVMDGDLSIHHT